MQFPDRHRKGFAYRETLPDLVYAGALCPQHASRADARTASDRRKVVFVLGQGLIVAFNCFGAFAMSMNLYSQTAVFPFTEVAFDSATVPGNLTVIRTL